MIVLINDNWVRSMHINHIVLDHYLRYTVCHCYNKGVLKSISVEAGLLQNSMVKSQISDFFTLSDAGYN